MIDSVQMGFTVSRNLKIQLPLISPPAQVLNSTVTSRVHNCPYRARVKVKPAVHVTLWYSMVGII